jgi:hypothetical protein
LRQMDFRNPRDFGSLSYQAINLVKTCRNRPVTG